MKIDRRLPVCLLLLFSTHVIFMLSAFAYGPKLSANELKRFESKIEKLSNSFLSEMAALEKKGFGTDGKDAADVSYKYAKRVMLLNLDTLHPDDLAALALWAESRNPTFSASYVFEYVFETAVHSLGKLRNQKAQAAIQRVKLGVQKRGHLDGHIGETISKAEQELLKK